MKLTDVIIWILVVLSLAVAVGYIVGDSPTFEQTILIFLLTIIFTISTKTIRMKSKLNSLEKSFFHLAKDFKKQLKR